MGLEICNCPVEGPANMGCKAGLSFTLLLAAIAAAQDTDPGVPPYTVEHPECVLFGSKFSQLTAKQLGSNGPSPHQDSVSAMTTAVMAMVAIPGGSRTDVYVKEQQAVQSGSIDSFILSALSAAGVQ